MHAECRLRVAKIFFHCVLSAIVFAVIGMIISASLIRFAPGFGVDARELDSRLNRESIQAIKDSHQSEQNLFAYYSDYLNRVARGDLGTSHAFQQPIRELIKQRWAVSQRSMLLGLSMAWGIVLVLAASLSISQNSAAERGCAILAGAMLAIPTTMIGFFAVSAGHGVDLALSLVLAPTLFRYTRGIFERSYRCSYVLAARAHGISNHRMFMHYVMPTATPQILGLAGVSVSMAIGALIPLESLCDSPGLGALALQAAFTRDLPLLISLTTVVTIVTLVANMTSDIFSKAIFPRSI